MPDDKIIYFSICDIYNPRTFYERTCNGPDVSRINLWGTQPSGIEDDESVV